MTREEAKSKLTCYGYSQNKPLADYKVIDQIYDDIESRICENCKHYNMDTAVYYCDTYDIVMINDDNTIRTVDKDFGCNKFVRKLESK